MNRYVYGGSRLLAWFGALVLGVLAVVSVASIAGRAMIPLGLGPVPGDFELVEAGTALAVFCFLPWCHLQGGHAVVDLLWSAYPPAMRRVLGVLTDTLMLVVWVVLTWRMGVAMLEYRANAETTFILQMPVWWGYAASMVPAVLGCFAYLWRVLESLGVATPPPGIAVAPGGH
jgi:TRAP-type C4-dicarboxylate transport system permease small subunit